MNIQADTTKGEGLWVVEKSSDVEHLKIEIADRPATSPGPGQVVVEVKAAGVNPSDVKAAMGFMPHAIWPRVPGRDFAGIVCDGPQQLVGTEVWGGGGEIGITQDGSHARWMTLPQAAVRAKPANLSFEEAGSVGVPFITAFEGLREAGGVQPWDNVLVCGANGKVGQAVIQLATLAGARVFGAEYKPMPYQGHASGEIEMMDSSSEDIAAAVREATGERGVDIVFNTVGSPYFEIANNALADQGRQIFISTFERSVPFDIFTFFRGRHRFIGINTLALDSIHCARIFDKLKPKFEDGSLRPFPINSETVFGFKDAAKAYAAVERSSPDRVILRP
jgi:NADPH2:quinone reductase